MPEKEISALPIFWRKKERRKEIILFTQKKKKNTLQGFPALSFQIVTKNNIL